VTFDMRAAMAGRSPAEIRAGFTRRFGYDLSRSVEEIRQGYGFDVTCQGSVPQAITCALEASGYEDALRNAVSIGGDTDTIAAIAGGSAAGGSACPGSTSQPRSFWRGGPGCGQPCSTGTSTGWSASIRSRFIGSRARKPRATRSSNVC
jgi:hypothetical protein